MNNTINFEPFRLDLANACLWQGSCPIAPRPKAFAILQYLLERPGRLVTTQELLEAVWPDTYVGEAVLLERLRHAGLLSFLARRRESALTLAGQAPRSPATIVGDVRLVRRRLGYRRLTRGQEPARRAQSALLTNQDAPGSRRVL